MGRDSIYGDEGEAVTEIGRMNIRYFCMGIKVDVMVIVKLEPV